MGNELVSLAHEGVIRALSLYWPLLVLAVLVLWLRPGYHARVGLMLGMSWVIAFLSVVNWVAVEVGWWVFRSSGVMVLGMPLELLFGWVFWWGAALPLVGMAVVKRSWWRYLLLVVGLALAVDGVVMPRLEPVVGLATGWWWGELSLVVSVLCPAAMGVWWTHHRTCLWGRALLQAGTFGVLLLVMIPGVEAGGWGWLQTGMERPWWQVGLLGGLAGSFGLLACLALREFVVEGGGTPVPFDPPLRLVRTGVYARLANPMQVAMTGLLVVWGIWFERWWLLIFAVLGVVYSEGLARWSEREAHRERFGEAWVEYRRQARRWWPRS